MAYRYKAVLFDLDGTLLDTLDDITDSINETLKRFHIGRMRKDDVRRLVGNGVRKLLEEGLALTGGELLSSVDMLNRLQTEYTAIYGKNSAVKTKPYDGISELLDWLKGEDIHTGVLSNKPHQMTLDVLEFYFPSHAFGFAAGQRDGFPRKPNPAGVYEFCDSLGLSVRDVLFVGDSEVDLETGRNADIDCIGVLWGFRDEDTLRGCGAKALIHSPGELKGFF